MRITPFGVGVELVTGANGQIHISELGESIRHPSEVVALGEQIEAVVLHVDPWERRIGLSRKRASREDAKP